MITEYVDDIMAQLAQYEIIEESEPYYGFIKGKDFKGVWAQGKTLSECAHNLREVFEEWLVLKIRKNQFVPTTRKYNIKDVRLPNPHQSDIGIDLLLRILQQAGVSKSEWLKNA